jgi:hypothetical protein
MPRRVRSATRGLLDTDNTLNDEVFSRDRSSLVKAADVDTTRKGDAERLGAEDGWRIAKQRSAIFSQS